MKTFEENWTAWLDDQLSGSELLEFEASLPDKAAAQAEKAEARKLGELLKRELTTHPLKNEDFFSHQLREQIVRKVTRKIERAALAEVQPPLGGRFRVYCGRAQGRLPYF